MIPSQGYPKGGTTNGAASFPDRERLCCMTTVILGMGRAHTVATGHWLALRLGQLSSPWELQAPQTSVALSLRGRASSLSRASSMRSCT